MTPERGHLTPSVGVHEAKTNLSRLLQDVARGEEVHITDRGVVVITADRVLERYEVEVCEPVAPSVAGRRCGGEATWSTS